MSKAVRTRNPEAVRQALREQALISFNRDGYHLTNSNEIARDAGYAAGTFYTQYENKRDLFLDAYRLWVEREWTSIEMALATKPRMKRAEAVVSALIAHHREWAGFRRSLRGLVLVDAEIAAARNENRRKQMIWLRTFAIEYGKHRLSEASAFAALLESERVLDAIADGDAASCGVSEVSLRRHLARRLGSLLE